MIDNAKSARPETAVLVEIMDPRRAKSEHEHVAARVIERLTRELDDARIELSRLTLAIVTQPCPTYVNKERGMCSDCDCWKRRALGKDQT